MLVLFILGKREHKNQHKTCPLVTIVFVPNIKGRSVWLFSFNYIFSNYKVLFVTSTPIAKKYFSMKSEHG